MCDMTEHIQNSVQLIELIREIGFLPLLDSGISGFSAEEIVDDDCRYVTFPEGGWDWPLWKWKGEMITGGGLVYGQFFAGKAGFISRDWWSDFCNYVAASILHRKKGALRRPYCSRWQRVAA